MQRKIAFIYLAMVILGVLSGLSGISWITTIGLTLSEVFIKIFQCISLPIVVLSLIVTLSSFQSDNGMHYIFRKTILYTLSTTLAAASLSALLYLLIKPSNVNLSHAIEPMTTIHDLNYLHYFVTLIPTNIFSPFLDHQVMGVLLLGITVGIAIRFIPEAESRQTVIHFFRGVHALFLVITKWIVKILPIGLYGFITTTIVQLHDGVNIKSLGQYLLVIVLANILQGFVILPLWLKCHGINPFNTMRKMLPALSLAFFSKSSAGTLPITMATAEKNLGIETHISRFVLPLCTNINMNGCAAFIFVTVIYLMQNQGIPITMTTMLSWIFIATIAAIGNAGVPMGCFFLSASLLASMKLPINLLGLILPFYSMIDMLETALNVWSDSCVVKMVNDKSVVHVLEREKAAA